MKKLPSNISFYFNIIVLLVSIPLVTKAQFYNKETANWIFGGLNSSFNPDSALQMNFLGNFPEPATLPNYNFNMLEGGTSFSDTSGNLLFYTTGNRIFNRLHQPMPSVDSLIGNQNESASQGSIIVRQPGSFTRYYVFTTPDHATPKDIYDTTGFRYHVVDMSLDSGRGDVVLGEFNKKLFDIATEKVCAVAHANGKDIWVMSHALNTNGFYAYLLTDTGLVTTAVVSQVGVPHLGANAGRGCMKFSPDGTKIALAITGTLPLAVVGYQNSIIEIADFDASTGIVSNPAAEEYHTPSEIFNAYAVEFSPDSKKLYTSDRCNGGQFGNAPDSIFQYDINAGTNADIIQSKTLVHVEQDGEDFGSFQLACDGKIYVSELFSPYLSVIENPNALGTACNFVENAIPLPQNSTLSLPNFCTSYFRKTIPDFIIEGFCANDTTVFKSSESLCCGQKIFEWDFGDTINGVPQTGIGDSVTYVYSQSGLYNVTLVLTDCFGSDTLTRQIEILPFLNPKIMGDSIVCAELTYPYSVNNVNDSVLITPTPYTYEWQTDQTANVVSDPTLTQANIFFRNTTTADSALIRLVINNNVGCPPDTFTFKPRVDYQQIEKPEGPTNICYEDFESGASFTYSVPDSTPGTRFTWQVNGGQIVSSTDTTNTVEVVWKESNTQTIQVTDKYNPAWPDSCFDGSKSLLITILPPMDSLNVLGDSLICEYTRNVPYFISNPSRTNSTFYWSVTNGDTLAGLSADTLYVSWTKGQSYGLSVYEESALGCKSPVTVLNPIDTCWMIPNVFTPNGDGINDAFYVKNMERYPTRIWIYNRWGQQLFSRDPYLPNNLWQAKDFSTGVYFYRVDMKINNTWRSFKGSLSVLK